MWIRRVAALCILAPLALHATTLVAIWTPERVLLAADSRVVLDGGSAEGCKIARVGSTWFAVAGLVLDTSAQYHLNHILQTALRGGTEIRERAERFIETAQPALGNALAGMQRNDPLQYAVFADGRPVLQALLVETKDSRPLMITVSFALDRKGSLQPRASLVDGTDGRGLRIIYAGQQTRIREYLHEFRNWAAEDNVELVEKLVQLEVDASTPWVGGPVDIVEVGRSARWLKAKSACRD